MHIQVNCPQFSLFISHLKSNQEDIWISFSLCPFHNTEKIFKDKKAHDVKFGNYSHLSSGGFVHLIIKQSFPEISLYEQNLESRWMT